MYNVQSEDTQKNVSGMISVGSLRVTLPAFIVLVAGLVLATVIAFTVPLPQVGIAFSLFILLAAIVTAYNVNCVQVGHCVAWGWFLAILNVLYFVLMIILMSHHTDLVDSYKPQKLVGNTKLKNLQKPKVLKGKMR